ncbi:MvaI/BcnI family restriction endonuclease [Paenarthrobacter nitroguajacolicus]|uniref:MvaI/BcnI family restriction endonuclease n=1 Tax=Paenarthrobacter nitroguajacolicus TaxID=211146 RepID=UPI00248BC492|nr:MvaI/BcnI family restriction endonuclease [Paenarthrobacter nitroguajacolicus]
MLTNLWQDEITESSVRRLFIDNGVKSVQIKYLKDNHNSKNQMYLAGDLTELANLPMGEVTVSKGTSKKKSAGGELIYHAPVSWAWLSPGGFSPAPKAQLIVYPQYPEVRLSSLLLGSRGAPNALFSQTQPRGQEEGRVLIFGANDEFDTTFAMIVSGRSPAAKSLDRFRGKPGKMVTIPVGYEPKTSQRYDLMRELATIHKMDWLEAVELPASRVMRACRGPRCGGHTLEAHLGITLNGAPAPDFGDWEVKQHAVTSFDRPGTGHITLFTPEPDLGDYAAHGTDWFARTYGVPTDDGARYNFTGRHFVTGRAHGKTGLELRLVGYDSSTNSITADGYVGLVGESGELVSGWSFAKLLKHWQTKHAYAAYVPSQSTKEVPRHFRYGHRVHLAEGTRFGLFLHAMATGAIAYDPGIKSERQINGTWKPKARSQFRVHVKALSQLYDSFTEVDVLSEAGME